MTGATGYVYATTGCKLLFYAVFLLPSVFASTPNVILSVDGANTTWLAKRGLFGSEADSVTGELVHSPESDWFLCNEDRNETLVPTLPPNDIIMVVPRGNCSYESKAFAAKERHGAVGILIYDNLSAKYGWNETTKRVIFPIQGEFNKKYECANGYGMVHNLTLDPPAYNGTELDLILDMTSPTTKCSLNLTRTPCESQLCLVTSHKLNSTDYPVCCAWDLPASMNGDEEAGDTSDIVAVFITIRQSQEILTYIGSVGIIEARPYTFFNISVVFLWILGVAATAFGSYYIPTQEYREFRARLAKFQEKRDKHNDEEQSPAIGVSDDELDRLVMSLDNLDDDDDEEDDNDDEDEVVADLLDSVDDPKDQEAKEKKDQPKRYSLHSLPPARKHKDGRKKESDDKEKVWVLYSLPPPERKNKKGQKKKQDNIANASNNTSQNTTQSEGVPDLPPPERKNKKGQKKKQDNIDTTQSVGAPDLAKLDHIPESSTASPSFELTQWHVLSFVVCSSILLFLLFYFQFYDLVTIFYGFGCAGAVSYLIFGPILVSVIPRFGDEWTRELNTPIFCGLNGFDVTSQLLGFIWAIIWLWYGLSHYKPSTNVFFWISLDVFGICFCVLSLGMVRLNNTKVATMLMLAIFFYDIFFVFITPLFLDGESVMITVARGGGSDQVVDDFCVRYPEDKACTGMDFLPMLLLIPRVNDYNDGVVLLGLGDIVLPGFLIAFTARVDEAARLVGKHTSVDVYVPEKWYQGYFFPIMVAYAVGLFLAFMAFCLTGSGQPALLYLVPCLLGTMFFIGRKELNDLWKGARQLRLADKLKRKCEKAWGRERMKRLVAKKKRERALAEQQEGARRPGSSSRIDATGRIEDHNSKVPRQSRSDIPPPSGPPGQPPANARPVGRGGRGPRGRGSSQRGPGRGPNNPGRGPNNTGKGRGSNNPDRGSGRGPNNAGRGRGQNRSGRGPGPSSQRSSGKPNTSPDSSQTVNPASGKSPGTAPDEIKEIS